MHGISWYFFDYSIFVIPANAGIQASGVPPPPDSRIRGYDVFNILKSSICSRSKYTSPFSFTGSMRKDFYRPALSPGCADRLALCPPLKRTIKPQSLAKGATWA